MRRPGSKGRPDRLVMKTGLTRILTLALALGLGLATADLPAQDAAGPVPPVVVPTTPTPAPAPGVSVVGPATTAEGGMPVPVAGPVPGLPPGPGVIGADGMPVPGPGANPIAVLPPEVQVVRFQGPEGVTIEVLGPAPIPIAVPPGEGGSGALTVGLQRGAGYRLRVANLPERPGAEVFPVVEVVGHLHRPEGIDPGKYPIRVIFTLEDLDTVLDLSRLVTKVIYLEDPDQALPLHLGKDQIPVVTLNPAEHPLRVASALGRPMAVVRIGGRRPTLEEVNGGPAGDLGLDWVGRLGTGACPYVRQDGTRCPLTCGPACTAPVSPIRTGLPRDEYLCDGGDRGTRATPLPGGRLGGIDPRDAVVRFDIGLGNRVQPRTLPTNVVCIYAPRFAEVRVLTGANATVDVQGPKVDLAIDTPMLARNKENSRRLVQNQSAELARQRSRASGFKGREWIGEASNDRRLGAYNNVTQLASNRIEQKAQLARNKEKPVTKKERVRLQGIKTAESPLMTGISESASEAVMVWASHSMTGVETPPNRPGLAVIKRVSAAEAEPGDRVTYVIYYRNMGNTPIREVTIADSLLPRLEYLKGTSRGPEGTVFRSELNRVGSTELRWVLPGILKPGEAGHVSFEVIVR